MSEAKATFEYAISDAEQLLECYDQLNGCNSNTQPPEVLKRATLIMTLTAWETYVEDVAKELVDAKYGVVMGSQLGRIVESRLEEHLKYFNNPGSKKTKALFEEFFGIDVTDAWVWNSFKTADESRTQLNTWLKKRGEAVHRAQTDITEAHIVKREELNKCIRFFRELVSVTDARLSDL
ncbi:HEPN domain-containing protein [Vibrio diabolicus]|uniref:HEPN domain-containing protein n=1 Tax=Vibrio diabolicus TaxID=50719 RepID=UPI00232E05A1|nr:HEPN domain-containing protein [Vibrio diabolicus]